ncbi:hypothetical protein V8C34DRAFT_320760 [Trichoderma compactum]
MPPFERPKGPFRSSQLRAWSDNVEPRMHDLLWGDYWQRFNTIQIPIFRPNELACKMLTAAMRAIDKEDTYLCKNARDTVSDLCQTGCFLDFLRVLIGTSHGWEADAAEDSKLHSTTGNLGEETQASVEQIQDSSDEETQEETLWLGDDYYEAPMNRRTREELWARSVNSDMGTFVYARCTSSSEGTDDPESDMSRDLSDDEVVTARSLRRRLMGITPGPITYPLTPQGEIDWEAIDDEFLFNSEMDEYDDEDHDEEDDYDGDEDSEEEEDGGNEGRNPIRISSSL